MRRERVGQGDAVAVGQPAHGVGVERAGAGARAEQAAAEARALLVGPVDELERERARLGGERAQHLERGDDAERAVEPAAVGHRVEVAADDHEALVVAGRVAHVLPAASVSTVDAADRVELAAQPVARERPRCRSTPPAGRRARRR